MNYKFREIREDKELKQHQVADAINKSRGAYANIEAETANIKLNELLTYCNYFGLSMDYVCRLTNKINYDFGTEGKKLKDVNILKSTKLI